MTPAIPDSTHDVDPSRSTPDTVAVTPAPSSIAASAGEAREQLGAGRIVPRTPKRESKYRDYQAEKRRRRRDEP